MTRGILLAALLISVEHAGGQAVDSVFVLSERLGAEIDRLERDYFGLFPDLPGYVSAGGYRASDSQIGFKIHRQDGEAMDTVVVIDTLAAAELRAYLEEFETISQRRRVTKAKLDANVVRKPQRVVNTPRLVRVSFLGGAVDSGMLLCVTDTSFVLWNAHGSPHYRWQDAWRRIRLVHCSAVEKIVVGKRAPVLMMTCAGGFVGMVVGAVWGLAAGDTGGDWPMSAGEKACCLGGCLGIGGLLSGGSRALLMNHDRQMGVKGMRRNYTRILPNLRNYAVFDTVIPPEVNRMLFQAQ